MIKQDSFDGASLFEDPLRRIQMQKNIQKRHQLHAEGDQHIWRAAVALYGTSHHVLSKHATKWLLWMHET